MGNIVTEMLKKPARTKEINELSVKQTDSIFINVLSGYALDSSWVSIHKIRKPENDSVRKEYLINLPKDLPVPYIIRDLNNKFDKNITGLVSEEKKSFGTTEIKIYSNETLKLQAVLEPSADLLRDRNKIYFIIEDSYSMGISTLKDLLESPVPLTLCLLPSDNSSSIKDTIKSYSKDYAILINNDISENKYRMEPGYPKGLLRNSVTDIIDSYKDASLFVIDTKSKLFNSAVYNFIRDNFKSWGIKLYRDSDFIRLKGKTDSDILSLMKFYAETKDSVRDKVFITDKKDFDLLKDELALLKKRGNKFLPVKTYLRAP